MKVPTHSVTIPSLGSLHCMFDSLTLQVYFIYWGVNKR